MRGRGRALRTAGRRHESEHRRKQDEHQAVARHSQRAGSRRDKAQKKLETRLFIDGKYVDAKNGGRFATINPADGEVVAEMAAGTAKDIDRAVAAATQAFKSGGWSKLAPRARMAVLYRFAELIDENAEELAVLETLDMGKPIADVVNIDLPAVVDTIRFLAECIDKVEGAVTSTGPASCTWSCASPRRRRRDLAVELSAAHGDVEDRARARGRQHRRAEARRAGAA